MFNLLVYLLHKENPDQMFGKYTKFRTPIMLNKYTED